MSTIDRIRYYDGEFLRAFDFEDEQTYHMAMRRRLNRYLHLCGIAQGLIMVSSSDSDSVSIMPGMAIDALGREIYVYAPYTLGDSDVTTNRIISAGTYDVWLRYQKSPGTPPSSGYANCNQANQYTRWIESFSVVLLSSPSTPFASPGFGDADSDDPSQDQVGVLLGKVFVDPAATTTFSKPQFDPGRCTLLGVVAQSITTPASWDATRADQPFSFLNARPVGVPNTPLGPPASLEIVPNIFANQNLIVGQDFPLSFPKPGPPTSQITPSPTVTDPGVGSVKIAGDLFVQGNIYNLITSNTPAPVAPEPYPPLPGTDLWLGITSYVKQLVQQGQPDVAIGSLAISVPHDNAPVNAGYAQKTDLVPVQSSRLSSASSYIAFAYFSRIQLNPAVASPPAAQLSIQTPPPAKLAFNFTGGNTGQVSVPWLAGPAIGPGIAPNYATSCAVDNFTISCIVFLFP